MHLLLKSTVSTALSELSEVGYWWNANNIDFSSLKMRHDCRIVSLKWYNAYYLCSNENKLI